MSDCKTWINVSGKYFQPTLQQVEHWTLKVSLSLSSYFLPLTRQPLTFSLRPQKILSMLEEINFTKNEKKDIVSNILLNGNIDHYVSFFVCRNPIQRLLSVYNFLLFIFRKRSPSNKKWIHSKYWIHLTFDKFKLILRFCLRLKNNFPQFNDAILTNRPLPSWIEFLEDVVLSDKNVSMILPLADNINFSLLVLRSERFDETLVRGMPPLLCQLHTHGENGEL